VIDPADHELRDRLVAMTRDLILIPSIPSRPDDRRRCYEFLKNHLEGVEGVRVEDHEEAGHPSLVALPHDLREPEVLMCAHLDVITHPDIGFYRSELRDGRIIGPGAGDMKGTLAILLDVFREMHGRHPGVPLGLAITSDEETGGEHGIGYLFGKGGWRCGTAMIPDGGSLLDVTVEEKGIIHLRARCRGHSAHAARPWLGDNPIPRLLSRLEILRRWFEEKQEPEGHWFPTCATTVIGTENETVNRIPTEAHAVLDIRFPPPHTVASLLDQVRTILGAEVETEVIIQAEATHLQPDPLYLRVTEEISGATARLVRDCGGSDARFVCRHGIPVLMSRPLVGNLHAEDEWIEVASMVQFHHIYRRYLERRWNLV